MSEETISEISDGGTSDVLDHKHKVQPKKEQKTYNSPQINSKAQPGGFVLIPENAKSINFTTKINTLFVFDTEQDIALEQNPFEPRDYNDQTQNDNLLVALDKSPKKEIKSSHSKDSKDDFYPDLQHVLALNDPALVDKTPTVKDDKKQGTKKKQKISSSKAQAENFESESPPKLIPICAIQNKDEEENVTGSDAEQQFANLYRAAGAGMKIAIVESGYLHELLTSEDEKNEYRSQLNTGLKKLNNLLQQKQGLEEDLIGNLAAWITSKKEDQNFKTALKLVIGRKETSSLTSEEKVQLYAHKWLLDNQQTVNFQNYFLKALSEVLGLSTMIDGGQLEQHIKQLKTSEQLKALYLNVYFKQYEIPVLCQDAFWEGMCISPNVSSQNQLQKNYAEFFAPFVDTDILDVDNTLGEKSKSRAETFDHLQSENASILATPNAQYSPEKFQQAYKDINPADIQQRRRQQMRRLAKLGLAKEYHFHTIHEKSLDQSQDLWIKNELNSNVKKTTKSAYSAKSSAVAKFLKILPYIVFSLLIFAISFLSFFASLALKTAGLYSVLEVLSTLGQLLIPGLGAYVASKVREKLFPRIETELETTFARIESVEAAILKTDDSGSLKPPQDLTPKDKEDLLDFLQAYIALMKNHAGQLQGFDITKYPDKGRLNNLVVLASVLESERDTSKGLKGIKNAVNEDNLAIAFADAYQNLPDILGRLKNCTVLPKPPKLGFALNVFFLTCSLFIAAMFALLVGDIAGFTNRMINGMLLTFYPGETTAGNIADYFSYLFPTAVASMGFLSMFGVSYFAGEVTRSLPFNNYRTYKKNYGADIEQMKALNIQTAANADAPSNQFGKLNFWQRFSSGLISGLTFGIIKRNDQGEFAFLGKSATQNSHDMGRQLFKAILNAAVAGLLVFFLATPLAPFGFSMLYIASTVYGTGVFINTLVNVRGFANEQLTLPLKPWSKQGAWGEVADFAKINTTDFTLGMVSFDAELAKKQPGKKPSIWLKGFTYITGVAGFGALATSVFLLLIAPTPIGFILLGAGALSMMVGIVSLTNFHPGWRLNLINRNLLGYAGIVSLMVGFGLLIAGGPIAIPATLITLGAFFIFTRLGGLDIIINKTFGVKIKLGIKHDAPEQKINNLRNFIKLAIFATAMLLLVMLAPSLGFIGINLTVSASLLFMTYALMVFVVPTIKHLYARLQAPVSAEFSLTKDDELSENDDLMSQSTQEILSEVSKNDSHKKGNHQKQFNEEKSKDGGIGSEATYDSFKDEDDLPIKPEKNINSPVKKESETHNTITIIRPLNSPPLDDPKHHTGDEKLYEEQTATFNIPQYQSKIIPIVDELVKKELKADGADMVVSSATQTLEKFQQKIDLGKLNEWHKKNIATEIANWKANASDQPGSYWLDQEKLTALNQATDDPKAHAVKLPTEQVITINHIMEVAKLLKLFTTTSLIKIYPEKEKKKDNKELVLIVKDKEDIKNELQQAIKTWQAADEKEKIQKKLIVDTLLEQSKYRIALRGLVESDPSNEAYNSLLEPFKEKEIKAIQAIKEYVNDPKIKQSIKNIQEQKLISLDDTDKLKSLISVRNNELADLLAQTEIFDVTMEQYRTRFIVKKEIARLIELIKADTTEKPSLQQQLALLVNKSDQLAEAISDKSKDIISTYKLMEIFSDKEITDGSYWVFWTRIFFTRNVTKAESWVTELGSEPENQSILLNFVANPQDLVVRKEGYETRLLAGLVEKGQIEIANQAVVVVTDFFTPPPPTTTTTTTHYELLVGSPSLTASS